MPEVITVPRVKSPTSLSATWSACAFTNPWKSLAPVKEMLPEAFKSLGPWLTVREPPD